MGWGVRVTGRFSAGKFIALFFTRRAFSQCGSEVTKSGWEVKNLNREKLEIRESGTRETVFIRIEPRTLTKVGRGMYVVQLASFNSSHFTLSP
jgi:hypothetical protein